MREKERKTERLKFTAGLRTATERITKIPWQQGTNVYGHLKKTEHDFHYVKIYVHQDKVWKGIKKEGSKLLWDDWDKR